ncbi:MAG: TolC family protein [Culturomica sp.]|jgi:outer membrane protein|nr:TolC family protein [Culturomica sp.]
MRISIIITLLLCSGFTATISAQSVDSITTANVEPEIVKAWTLKQCIEYAVENNIDIRQRILQNRSAEIELNTTRNSRLPNLNANMGQNFYFGRGPGRDGTYQDQTQSSSSLSVNANVSIFSGLNVSNRIKANELNLQATIEDFNKAKEDLALNITSYFLQVIYNKELLAIADEQLELTKKQLADAESLVENGKSPESDLYDARSALARDEAARVETANALKLSLLDLAQLLNFPDIEKFDIEMTTTDTLPVTEYVALVTPDNIYDNYINNRPSIKAAELRLKSSEYDLKVAKSAYYPSLSLGASYSNSYYHTYNPPAGTINESLSTQWSRNGSENIGLSLNIPIFNRMSSRNQVRNARISMENSQLALDNVRQQLYKEIQQAYYNAIAAKEKYEAAKKAVDASRIAFIYELRKYTAGRSTSYQFEEAKKRLSQTTAETAQAKYNLIFRTKILDFYKGVPLF